MSKVAVGKETSQRTGSEIYVHTYQGLLRQKEKIDRDLLRLQEKFLMAISKSRGILPDKRAKYVPRLYNTTILASAIRKCMIPNTPMTMGDILKSLSNKDLYHTDSKYFYTMVNNKLNRDPIIKKISRGVFIYDLENRKKDNMMV